MKKLGIDCDGVVFDFVGQFYKVANPMFGTSFSGPQLTWDFEDEFSPEQVDKVWDEIKRTKNFWMTLRPMPGTKYLQYLRDKSAELFFITSRMDTAGMGVREQSCWALRNWFGITYPTVIVVEKPGQKKSIAQALELDSFIDDKRATIIDMHEAGLRSYAHLAPYNSSKPFPEGVLPVETLDEFLQLELKIGS
jgi:hypothetical protein